MGQHVIDFSTDGRVEAMHTDKFDLSFLGDQKINRASDIRFNEDTQLWGVWLTCDGEFVKPVPIWDGFKQYEQARKFEVAVLNACREAQVHPTSETGLQIAATLSSLRQA